MPRSSKTKTRRKRLRRLRNRRRREALLRTEPEQVRVRTSFSGKARSGDEATLDLEFSDVSVPFDPESEEFAQETDRRHAAAEAWHDAGHPTSGEG